MRLIEFGTCISNNYYNYSIFNKTTEHGEVLTKSSEHTKNDAT